MDLSDLIDIIMVFYQDDLTTFSKNVENHCLHLEKVSSKALEYRIFLNPKKCHFSMTKGNYWHT